MASLDTEGCEEETADDAGLAVSGLRGLAVLSFITARSSEHRETARLRNRETA